MRVRACFGRQQRLEKSDQRLEYVCDVELEFGRQKWWVEGAMAQIALYLEVEERIPGGLAFVAFAKC